MMGRWAQRFAIAIRRPLVGYALALAAVLAAVLVHAGAGLVMTSPPNFMAFFPAVLFATLVAGLRGGLLATVLSAGAVWLLWLPKTSLEETWRLQHMQLLLFVVTAALTVLIAKAIRLAVLRGAAAEERFRIFQEQGLDGFVILEPVREAGQVADFRWTYANPAADRMAPGGQGLTGRRVSEVFTGETASNMVERLRKALDNGVPDELDVRRVIDGQERWMRSSAMRLGDSVAVNFRDITDQRRAEEEARRSRDEFEHIANAAPVMIWMSGVSMGAIWFNASWLAFTGRRMEEELARGWLEEVHPEDRERVLATYDEHFATQSRARLEYRIMRHDGAYRWIDEAAAPRFDRDGRFLGYIGSCSDITEIVEARRHLEERVAERTRELEASLEERARAEAALAQAHRLETVGRLTGGVAHDFNNLLTVVIGGLDMILKNPADTARVKKLSEAALAAGRRGERLTRQLLAFSRRQELKLEVMDVGGLIEQVEPLVRRAVGEAIDLTVDCEAGVGATRLDPAQFEAALLNLVVNAADAVEGSGRINIHTRRVTLAEGEVSGASAGEHVAVSVSDTGAGMSPEVMQRAFEPFFTTKDVGKGTGLGLAQVYGFMSQCGGAVAIDSRPGEGTTVTLYVPAIDAVPTTDPVRPAADDSWAAGTAILLVEDDDAVRAVTESLLQEMGCEVTTEIDGPSAMARLQTGQAFDLLISDIVMPGGMNGVELASWTHTHRPELPIVLTTGYAGDQFADGATEIAWPVVRKPFRAEQLSAAVRDALARVPT